MNKINQLLLLGTLAVLWGCVAYAQTAPPSQMTLPWDEFKTLYRAQLERELVPPVQPARYTLEAADYRVQLTPTEARVLVQLRGRVLAGARLPLPLFDVATPVVRVGTLTGGVLLAEAGKLCLLPDESGAYQVELELVPVVKETARGRVITLVVPTAVRNSAELVLDPSLTLLEAPGVRSEDGRYYFSAQTPLQVAYRTTVADAVADAPSLDVQTSLSTQAERLLLQVRLQPTQPVYGALQLRLPPGATWIGGSVNPAWVRQTEQALRLTLPPGHTEALTVQLALTATAAHQYPFSLPQITDNRGNEGRFSWREPEDSQWQLSGTGWRALTAAQPGERSFQAEPNAQLQLHITPYTALSTPPLVLGQLQWFTSFAEGGQVLSVLRLDVPPEAGTRLLLPAVQDARVWALKVNGVRKEVYVLGEQWVIPLSPGALSKVELAYVRQGAKLGLQGRLEAVLPALGLPAREVQVGMALPTRVMLETLEGDFTPLAQPLTDVPAEFIGRGYFFSSAFYQGDAMPLAISYLEPVQAAGATP
jgi:hypothetical protein